MRYRNTQQQIMKTAGNYHTLSEQSFTTNVDYRLFNDLSFYFKLV